MSVRKRIFLVAGEHSGDFLGGALMRSLDEELQVAPLYSGVGGEHMQAAGLTSLFPLEDVAVMGLLGIIAHLPKITKRVYQSVDAAIAFSPDIVVVIDSPEFTHAIAKRIRRKCPNIPIINYVSPSVWAWRPWRAKKMKAYVDHILALLPFEPDVHKRLGGPECTYVGHPLIEKMDYIRSCDGERLRSSLLISKQAKKLVVLPGSRPNEVRRLMATFGEVLEKLSSKHSDLQVLVPLVPSVETLVLERMRDWPCKVHLLRGEEDKYAAFNMADAALAVSGTVTLELALTKTPMVVAYKLAQIEYKLLLNFISGRSFVLANLILPENVFPEFLQNQCTSDNLAVALDDLLSKTPSLVDQRTGLDLVEQKILLKGTTPSKMAAKIVMSYLDG